MKTANNPDNELIRSKVQDFSLVLSKISCFLDLSGHSAQRDYVQNLNTLLKENNLIEFVNQIKSVNMWGGAGAVWEVSIDNEAIKKSFREYIIRLVELLQATGLDTERANSIRKSFSTNY